MVNVIKLMLLVSGLCMLLNSITVTGKAATSRGRSPAVVGIAEVYHGGRSPAVVPQE